MAYRLAKSQDTVQDGVRKIATDLIDKAIDAAKQRRSPEQTVHELRKTCKRLRGLIRLVRPVFADYHTENAAFRDASRTLSYLRDTAVLIQTYDSLLDAYDDQVRSRAICAHPPASDLQQKQSAGHSEAGRRLEEFGQAMAVRADARGAGA